MPFFYVIETRKQDGEWYPSSSLNLLLCGLKRHIKGLNPAFLDEDDDQFAGLRGTRDVVAHKLSKDGLGASEKKLLQFLRRKRLDCGTKE